jgi:SMC interacting uncharacterized protein involved in chromosome segregation
MSFMDKLKSGLDKAQHEINDFAETTKLKMELSKLQGQKKELFTKIGQEVYELHAKGQATPSEATCKQVDDLEHQIAEKNEAIEKVNAAEAKPGAPTHPAT